MQEKLELGDIETKRDWSHASDVVMSMWLMLQRDSPSDYVIGSGQLHSIRELLEISFGYANLNWQDYVVSSPAFTRSVEYTNLCADNSKAINEHIWSPKTSFKQLIEGMTQYDMDILKGKI